METVTPSDATRAIPGFPRYAVTSDGRIKGPMGKWLKPKVRARNGHLIVNPMVSGRPRPVAVHIAVLLAWTGPCPYNMECCHVDGNPANNHIDNLRWDFRTNNPKRRKAGGRGAWALGEATGSSKLAEGQVREVRALLAAGELTMTQIGERFGVTINAISNIKRRATWGWLV